MAAQFSHVAKDYDAQFTHTEIGKLQREQVLKELAPILKREWQVLEINCGTGEDALWLSDSTSSVLATDISAEMIAVSREKSAGKDNIDFEVLDANKIASLHPKSFDFIFSNFGGLNCLSPQQLQQFLLESAKLLKPKGAIVLVIMGKKTLWEKLYFTLKGDRKSAKRRDTKEALFVHVDGKNVPTYYYSPSDVSRLAATRFRVVQVKPIGLFVPPSYMQHFFNSRLWALRTLGLLDRLRLPGFSNYADHFLIHLEKKSA
jgi:ubiquinone/menaquinone biosynthesis C-methylase UbiE